MTVVRLVDVVDSTILYLTDTSEALPAERSGVDIRQLESRSVFSLPLRETKR